MDDFEYNSDYQVLFYKRYKIGIKSLEGHLKDAHSLRARKERQPILDQYNSLVLLYPKDVRLPLHNCAPFDALGEPLDS
jgi:hypothetical protein